MWQKIRAVLAVLTDLLNIGRGKGWWEKGQAPGIGGPTIEGPKKGGTK